jgi:hypothetical protein
MAWGNMIMPHSRTNRGFYTETPHAEAPKHFFLPHSPTLRSLPLALSRACPQKQIPSSQKTFAKQPGELRSLKMKTAVKSPDPATFRREPEISLTGKPPLTHRNASSVPISPPSVPAPVPFNCLYL